MGRQDFETETLIPIRHGGFFDDRVAHALRAEGFDASEDGTGRGTGRGTPLVAFPIHSDAGRADSSAITPSADADGRVRLRDPGIGIGTQDDPMFSLTATTPHAIAVALRGREDGATAELGDDKAFALRASGGGGDKPHVLAFDCKSSGQNGFGVGEIASTMRAMGHSGSHANAGGHQAALVQGGVRRLTPRECERLQGFPDDYTLIQYRGKPAADGPRYKVCGNSQPVPVMRLILSRIEMYERDVRAKVEAA